MFIANNKIKSKNGMQSLKAELVKGDILLTYFTAGKSLVFSYAEMMKYTAGKPWSLKREKFSFIKFGNNGKTLLILGIGNFLKTRTEFIFKGDMLACSVEWEVMQNVKNASVAFVLKIKYDIKTEKVTLPMNIYNNNPAVEADRVAPHFARRIGESFIEEETRYPVPCANVEWIENGKTLFVSLFSIPNSGAYEWTLGVNRPDKSGVELVAASGIVSFNGKKDKNYGAKNESVHIESGYNNFKCGNKIKKDFVIRFGEPESAGQGFRDIIKTGYEIFRPKTTPALTLDEVVKLKALALNERWHEEKHSAGFLTVTPDNIYLRRPYYLWGWTGQSFRLAYCSAKLGIETKRKELVERAVKCAEFFLKESSTRIKGLHYNRYLIEEQKWEGEKHFPEERLSSRALGETFWNFSKLILLFQENGIKVPIEWLDSLYAAAGFFISKNALLPEGIPPIMWLNDGSPAKKEVNSSGTACIGAVLGAYKVSKNKKYLKAAEKMLEKYWKIGGDKFDTPFSKATLDAGCEDKEAAVPFFVSACDLYYITCKQKYKRWAEISGDWLLTWVYFWHTGFRKGSICEAHKFITTGWPSVSVENQHLDVFFPAHEMYEFGRKTKNKIFASMGKTIFEAWSHGISKGTGDWFFDKPGRQGEQFFQTKWSFNKNLETYPKKVKEHFRRFGYMGAKFGAQGWRGGYNPWDTSWIIAMVLEAALSFKYKKSAAVMSKVNIKRNPVK
ncbi:MAG: hypothetical protein V1752_06180 [Candidatus Firestonebacteria bacterium]